MSKPSFNKRPIYPIDKNVFVSTTIPEPFKDQIRSIVNSGEYGKLEELLINYPVNLSFAELNLNTSLLHAVIQSQLTKPQKLNLITLLIKHGISIDNLDENGYAPLYYAIKSQDYDIVSLLIEHNSKLNKLSKNYDYFRLALTPSIGQCKSQLFNIQDQAMMSKYYSQQMKLERDLKIQINAMPFNREIIDYLLDFITNLPEERLTFIDLSNNTIHKELNIKLLGDDVNQYIPQFENKLYYTLEGITKELAGVENQDQLISKKMDITKSVRSELIKLLDVKSTKTIPSLDENFIYDQQDIDDLVAAANQANIPQNLNNIYGTFINGESLITNNLFDELLNKYQQKQQEMINSLLNIRKSINDLRNLLQNALPTDPRQPPQNTGAAAFNSIIGLGPGIQVDLDILLGDIDNNIYAPALPIRTYVHNYIFGQNDEKLVTINKFINTIRLVNHILIQIYQRQQFRDLVNPNLTLENANKEQKERKKLQEPIIKNLQNINFNNELIKNCKTLNEFIIEVNNITETGLLYKKYIQPPDNTEVLLFNDNFILTQYQFTDDSNNLSSIQQLIGNAANFANIINSIDLYSEKQIYYYNPPVAAPPAPVNYMYVAPPPAPIAINISGNLNDFPKPQLPFPPAPAVPEPSYRMIYLPANNQILNLRVIASIYHEHIFKSLLNPGNRNFYNLRDEFQRQNPDIRIEQINKLMLSSLDNSIKKNFEELANFTITVAAETLVKNKLLRNPVRVPNLTDQNITRILNQKLKLIEIERENRQQEFYLDENYTSAEPIDVIPCLNNNRKMLELLKRKMHVDPKEYQELIFKLGNSEVLNDLNTRDKITKNELNMYLLNHTQKFKDGLDFLNKQLDDQIKMKQLDFIVNNIPNNYLINNSDFDTDINNKTLNNITFKNIYKDLVNKQAESNLYMVTQLTLKLNLLFQNVILPQVKKFLQFFVQANLDATIDYNNIQRELQPIIQNIIYYHMNIDPTKSKETQIPLETSVDAFSNLFINLLDENEKTKLTSIYNDRLKSKILDLLTILCKYYGSVYRNFLKYIFNDTRYRRLDNRLV